MLNFELTSKTATSLKPKRIILVRHGESQGNVDNTIYDRIPDYALELTAKGNEQALQAGENLKQIIKDESVCFYISPMWRTRSTFEQIVKGMQIANPTFNEEPRIREQEWGHLRSATETAAIIKARDAYGTFYFRIPDGESAADVYDRVSDFFGSLHRDFEKEDFAENVIVVSHGLTIRLFLMKWFHWTVEQFELLANPRNCEIFVLEKVENSKYKLTTPPRHYDSTEHNFQRPVAVTNYSRS